MRYRFQDTMEPLIGGPVTQTVDLESAGLVVKWDASGSLASRADFDDEVAGFAYYAVDPLPHQLFVKLSNTAGDWSPGQVFGLDILPNIPTFANDAAAGTGGLVQGTVYKTATGELRIKL